MDDSSEMGTVVDLSSVDRVDMLVSSDGTLVVSSVVGHPAGPQSPLLGVTGSVTSLVVEVSDTSGDAVEVISGTCVDGSPDPSVVDNISTGATVDGSSSTGVVDARSGSPDPSVVVDVSTGAEVDASWSPVVVESAPGANVVSIESVGEVLVGSEDGSFGVVISSSDGISVDSLG